MAVEQTFTSMFGLYRTVLALAVAAAHLGGLPTGAHYAVFGFFILSGYLMTLILHQTYGYSRFGFLKYVLNRALRIYPPYWTSIILSALLIAWLGRRASVSYHGTMFLPDTPKALLENVCLVFSFLSSPRLTPPAWALTIELFFYLAIGLGLSRTPRITVAWFLVSAIYTVTINLLRVSFDVKYFLVPAASLPFSTGAMLYHFRASIAQRLPILTREFAPAVLLVFLALDVALSLKLRIYFTWGFYLSYALNALLIASLLDRQFIPGLSRNVDRIIGDFSYPIYLVHYQAGLILLAAGFHAAKRGQPLFFLVVLPLLFLLAWAVTRFVEWPVESIRKRIKGRRRAEEFAPLAASLAEPP